MDDLPTNVAVRAEVSAETDIRTRLTDYQLAWVDGQLIPTSSNIPESIAGLEREVDLACRPADEDDVKAWLTLLWVATKKQSSLGEFRTENVYRVYMAGLRRYPADLVREALSNWTSTPKPNNAHHWWPSLGEIEDAIRGPAETRRLIQSAVKGWDMDKAAHARLSQLYRELATLEAGDLTFNVRHLATARRYEQIEGVKEERAKVRAEILKLEGTPVHQRAAGES